MTYTILLVCILPFLSFSQNTETQLLTLKFSNAVASDLIAHTVNIDLEFDYLNDEAPNQDENNIIIELKEKILNVEGVTRVTFDQSTSTFTILSTEDNNLATALSKLNNQYLGNHEE